LGRVFKRENRKDGNFTITRSYLLQLRNLRIQQVISNDFLTNISDHLTISDYFVWDSDSVDGEVVSETICEWGNPEIDYKINDLNLRLWNEYLQTGEYKLGEYNNWILTFNNKKTSVKRQVLSGGQLIPNIKSVCLETWLLSPSMDQDMFPRKGL
jgi:hypothetical protein